MTLIAIAFLATFALLFSAGMLLFHRDAAVARLSSIVDRRPGRRAGVLNLLRRRPAVGTVTKPFQNLLPRSVAEVSVVQKRLLRAGYRDPAHLNVYYGAKLLVPLSLVLLATVTRLYVVGPFFVYALCAGLGFLAPDFFLGNRIAERQLRIRVGLPEALDLMVICTEAGLGLDQSMLRVSQEMHVSQPEIAEEFTMVLLEVKAGRPRDEALRSLATRTDVDSLRALVNTLVQATTFGTGIAKSLRVYSSTLRTQRRQTAEERAAKTTVKLVFPLVLFIFPSLFLVVLGPSLITILEGFDKYLLN